MRKSYYHQINTVLAICFFSTSLFAQVQSDTLTDPLPETSQDYEEIMDKYEEEIENDRFDSDGFQINIGRSCDRKEDDNIFRVGMLDLGVSTLVSEGNFNLPTELDNFKVKYPGSINANLRIVQMRAPLGKQSGLFLETGIGINWKQYKFHNNFRITPQLDFLELVNDGTNYDTNKLRTTFLELPLAFTFIPKNTQFNLTLGAYGGMMIGSSQKLKSEEFGKEIVKDDFNLRNFNSGLMARIGYRGIELYMQYGLQSIFVEEIETDLRPVTIGIAVIGF